MIVQVRGLRDTLTVCNASCTVLKERNDLAKTRNVTKSTTRRARRGDSKPIKMRGDGHAISLW